MRSYGARSARRIVRASCYCPTTLGQTVPPRGTTDRPIEECRGNAQEGGRDSLGVPRNSFGGQELSKMSPRNGGPVAWRGSCRGWIWGVLAALGRALAARWPGQPGRSKKRCRRPGTLENESKKRRPGEAARRPGQPGRSKKQLRRPRSLENESKKRGPAAGAAWAFQETVPEGRNARI